LAVMAPIIRQFAKVISLSDMPVYKGWTFAS
jgi:hypothetical protein